jgi:predicted RNA binding protein YcfA (HicA-like mRNA interferase family)
MGRFNNISGKEVIKAFKKTGWNVAGQVGSHVVMTREGIRVNLSIPQHKELSVDFLIEDEIAIEVKSSAALSGRDFKGLRLLSEEAPVRHRIIVCKEPVPRHVDGINVLPVGSFIRMLWEGVW